MSSTSEALVRRASTWRLGTAPAPREAAGYRRCPRGKPRCLAPLAGAWAGRGRGVARRGGDDRCAMALAGSAMGTAARTPCHTGGGSGVGGGRTCSAYDHDRQIERVEAQPAAGAQRWGTGRLTAGQRCAQQMRDRDRPPALRAMTHTRVSRSRMHLLAVVSRCHHDTGKPACFRLTVALSA